MNFREIFKINLTVILLLAACKGSQFGATGNQRGNGQPTSCLPDSTDPACSKDSLPTFSPGSGTAKETFQFGIQTSSNYADYLIVLDNSVSITTLKNLLTTQIKQSLSTFPAQSQIAVMNMIIGDPATNYTTVHSSISKYSGIEKEPGFLRLVSKPTIDEFLTKIPSAKSKFPLQGCTQEWFKPNDVNATGQLCLEAALQTYDYGIGIEAGVHVINQYLTKNIGKQLFRSGVSLNIIFVSDTHDPGQQSTAGTTLINTRPSYDQLKQLVLANTPVSNILFHAIAPAKVCAGTESYMADYAYNKLADAAGGIKIDVCTPADFSTSLQALIAQSSSITIPRFKLLDHASQIVSVTVNGQNLPSSEYTFDTNTQVLSINNLSTSQASTIIVEYAK